MASIISVGSCLGNDFILVENHFVYTPLQKKSGTRDSCILYGLKVFSKLHCLKISKTMGAWSEFRNFFILQISLFCKGDKFWSLTSLYVGT